EEYFELWATLSATSSALGPMLRNAKLGLISKHVVKQYGGDEVLRLRFAEVCSLMRDLTELETRALILRFCGYSDEELARRRRLRACGLLEQHDHELYCKTVLKSDTFPRATPVGDVGGECRATTRGGGLCRLPRLVDSSRCHVHQHSVKLP